MFRESAGNRLARKRVSSKLRDMLNWKRVYFYNHVTIRNKLCYVIDTPFSNFPNRLAPTILVNRELAEAWKESRDEQFSLQHQKLNKKSCRKSCIIYD